MNAPSPPVAISLRLFVAGTSATSQSARKNLDATLKSMGLTAYQLEIIDILKNPATASAENVFVTPTLVCVRDRMRSIMIGDLGNPTRLRAFLES